MANGRKLILLVHLFLVNIIFVNGQLKVTTDPTTVVQVLNSEVRVTCKVQQKTPGTTRITWKKDNVIIESWSENRPKNEAFVMQANKTLYIGSLERRLTGKYECVAFSQSSDDRSVATTTIEIKFLDRINETTPVRVYIGDVAEIKCKEPKSNPPATVSWQVNGTNLTKTSRMDPSGWTLKINNVSSNDAGRYTCIARNDPLLRDAKTNLTVIIPGGVQVTPKTDEILEGENATFECKSTAKPPLDTVWKRSTPTCVPDSCTDSESILESNERLIIERGKLTIINALPEDKGKYECKASLGSVFDASVVTLNVTEKIKEDEAAHQRNQSIDIREKNGRITCQFRGDGTYTVSWNRNGNLRLRDGIREENTALIINNVSFDDKGIYKCTAVGPKNTATAEVNLDVYKSSRFNIKPKNVTENVGKPVWIHCAGTGIPIPIVSYHRPGKIELNKTHFVTLPNGTLFIKELMKEDRGIYYCWLTQKQRIVEESFRITVLDAEDSSHSSSSSMGRTVGIAVGCAAVYILLVIGLMIYCRARRARLIKKGLITEADDYDVKDPLVNGEDIPLETTKSLDDWQVPKENVKEITTLGHGKMGRVFKAIATTDKYPDGALVSVKEFDSIENLQKEEFNLEVEMFLQLNHENVVKLIGVSNLNSPYYMMIEYSELGNLKEHLMNVSIAQTERCSMALNIAQGMEYLVSLRYIHRDLSARNCIAISNYKVKISFLSLCEDAFKEDYYSLNDVPVPLRWLSPEAITNESYSEKSDVWSFGVTLWEVFSGGQKPYFDYDNEQVRNGVCHDLRLPLPEKCPLHVYELMKKCWIVNTNERPSFQELAIEMSESFKTG